MQILEIQEGRSWSVFNSFLTSHVTPLRFDEHPSSSFSLFFFFSRVFCEFVFALVLFLFHLSPQVRQFSSVLESTGSALACDMDTLFSNLPIIRQRFKYSTMLRDRFQHFHWLLNRLKHLSAGLHVQVARCIRSISRIVIQKSKISVFDELSCRAALLFTRSFKDYR